VWDVSLRQLCKDRGYTFTKLSEEANISIPYLSRLNTGFYSNPSTDVLEKISTTINASTDEVIKAIRG
jgi:transcriptional regulator with XRE-family HTH domain